MKHKSSSRFAAAFLVLLMLFSTFPIDSLENTIEAEAAATNGVVLKIESLRKIFKTKSGGKLYFTTDGKAHEGNACKECYLPSVIKQNPDIVSAKLNIPATKGGYSCYGFTNFAFYYIFGYYPNISNSYSSMKNSVALTINTKNSSSRVSEISKTFENYVQPGDVLCYHYPNYTGFKADAHHFVIYTGLSSDKKSICYMDSNAIGPNALNLNGSRTISGLYTTKEFSIDTIYVYHATNYAKISGLTPKISGISSGNVSNTSAQLTGTLANPFVASSWSYYLSENRTEVNNVNGTNSSQQKSTGTMDFNRFFSGSSYERSRSVNVTKFKGSPLKANTTYYYKLVVQVGNSYYQSSVGSFKTTNYKPGSPKLRVSKDSSAVGIGKQVTLLWDAASLADSYNITVKDSDGNVVQTKSNIKGVTCVLDGMSKSGLYTASITAVNAAGSTNGSSVEFSVMPDQEITYYDTLGDVVVDTQYVRPGETANAPKGPVHEGHTFSKWQQVSTNENDANDDTPDYEKVVKIRYESVYDKNSYTVKFIDSFTNQVLKTQTVKYEEAASAPVVTVSGDMEGYEFAGWDTQFDSVKSDLNVYNVYRWADEDHSATVKINSVKRNNTKYGYDVNITISNKADDISSGRAVAVLKSAEGTILTSVESSAFAVDSKSDKSLTMTVLYPGLASKLEVYVINGYETLGKLTKTVSVDIDNSISGEYSEWIPYEGDCPMQSGSGIAVETKEEQTVTADKSYYRYQLKESTTSTATSLSGYTQNGYSLSKSSSGTVEYVASWPSGFDTGNYYYKKYKQTPKTAGENATTKTVINSNSNNGYVYWHWCRGESLGAAYNRTISYSKTSTYKKFHAFYSTRDPGTKTSDAYNYKNASQCGDSYWWGAIPVKKQTYTIYSKVYNYYKISDYSEWTEYSGSLPITEGQTGNDGKVFCNIQTKTEPGSTVVTKYYRYNTVDNPTISEPETLSEQIVNINGNVGTEFAGKPVTVWAYKYGQASNYTTEFVATTTVEEDGSVNIPNAVLREAPSTTSGDYKIAASVEGQLRAIEIGVIKAPKKNYTVKFYGFPDSSGNAQVISEQTVEEGGNAVLPDRAKLNVPQGERFTNWSESVVNVRSDMEVKPESDLEVYTAAFVNWENQTVSLKKFTYGSELIPDTVPEGKEGYVTEWVVQNGENYQSIEDYNKAGGVKGDVIIVTSSKPEVHEVVFVMPMKKTLLTASAVSSKVVEQVSDETEIDPLNQAIEEAYRDPDNNVLEIMEPQEVTYGDNISFEDVQTSVEEDDEIVFIGWVNALTGKEVGETEVTESMLLYPSYLFPETAEAPEISVETGEYTSEQTITLSTETENAVIWYTTDGSDPKTSKTAIEYTAPVTISKSCKFNCYTSAPGVNDSEITTNYYAINTPGSVKYHLINIDFTSVNSIDAFSDSYVWLVKDGSKLNVTLPEIAGNTFDKLYFDDTYTEYFDTTQESVTESMTLYAHYTANSYNVVFVYNDENGTEKTLSTQTVKYLSAAAAPNAPAIEGKVFAGWDVSFDRIVDDTKVTAVYIDENEYASIKLNRTRAISLAAGESFTTLEAEISPEFDYEIKWTSDNEDVAVVTESGVIYALSKGTANITASIPYTGASASVQVNVTVNTDIVDLENNSVISKTAANTNETITVSGSAAGGTEPYTYAFEWKKSSDSTWTVISAYGKAASASYSFPEAGTYDVRVRAKDGSGTVRSKTFTVTVTAAALANTSTISAAKVTAGTAITVTGAATGGTAPYSFGFDWKKSTDTAWTTKSAYGKASSVSLNFTKAGTYDVRSKVKDSTGTISSKKFTVTVTAAALSNTSTISAATVKSGTAVTVTGAATGGTAPYSFGFDWKKSTDTAWTTKSAYGKAASASFSFAEAGTYDVRSKVKDSTGTISSKKFTVTVTAASLANTSAISTTTVAAGTAITVTGAATGGTAPYSFGFDWKKSTDTAWTTKSAYGKASSVSLNFTKAGTYDVRSKVKDSAGTISSKKFTVTVTAAALANTSTISAETVAANTAITVKGTSTGGTAPYSYAFEWKSSTDTAWTTKSAYGKATTLSMTFAKAGTYNVRVKVKDSTGTIKSKTFTITVK